MKELSTNLKAYCRMYRDTIEGDGAELTSKIHSLASHILIDAMELNTCSPDCICQSSFAISRLLKEDDVVENLEFARYWLGIPIFTELIALFENNCYGRDLDMKYYNRLKESDEVYFKELGEL